MRPYHKLKRTATLAAGAALLLNLLSAPTGRSDYYAEQPRLAVLWQRPGSYALRQRRPDQPL